MAKRSKQSNQKRKQRRDHQKKHSLAQRQRREAGLERDLEYFVHQVDGGSNEAFELAIVGALHASQEWRTEPEFRALQFDPYEAVQASLTVWGAHAPSPKKLDRMKEEKREDLLMDLHGKSLALMLTSDFERALLRGFERFRKRLRRRRELELLGQAAAVERLLRDIFTDNSYEAAAACALLYKIYIEAMTAGMALATAQGELGAIPFK